MTQLHIKMHARSFFYYSKYIVNFAISFIMTWIYSRNSSFQHVWKPLYKQYKYHLHLLFTFNLLFLCVFEMSINHIQSGIYRKTIVTNINTFKCKHQNNILSSRIQCIKLHFSTSLFGQGYAQRLESAFTINSSNIILPNHQNQ